MLVLFVAENSDVATLRGKNKESEIFVSRLMETETTSVKDMAVRCWINHKASGILSICYTEEWY